MQCHSYTFKFTSRLVGALLIAIKIYSGRIILTPLYRWKNVLIHASCILRGRELIGKFRRSSDEVPLVRFGMPAACVHPVDNAMSRRLLRV